MNKLNIALKKQSREIERLKRCIIYDYTWPDGQKILVFDEVLKEYDEDSHKDNTQKKIDSGYYHTIEDFDGYHTADIEFEGTYHGKKIKQYRHKTMLNLIELGKVWRKRIEQDYPDVTIKIVVYKQDDEWFLDTYNYHVTIEGAIYL
jgi:hypothetical protein